jgi:hypothetical protein
MVFVTRDLAREAIEATLTSFENAVMGNTETSPTL